MRFCCVPRVILMMAYKKNAETRRAKTLVKECCQLSVAHIHRVSECTNEYHNDVDCFDLLRLIVRKI
jgi:hypothetical protein